ncbi:MAG: type II secretion system inner membrane protein GspF [Deltaproteobacteria bacterium]|nr:type II secretion system inner membrane protein GspF [Deltaproteobacteria bacterium]
MPVYRYKGVNRKGRAVAGLQDADNPKALKEALRTQGIFLSEVREASEDGAEEGPARKGGLSFLGGVKPREVSEVTRQLATLLRAAISVVDALSAVSRQVENPRFQRILNEVRRAVTEGKSLASAMGEHPKVFTSLYVNMVRAGESSGTLDLVFDRLADFMEAQVRLRSKLTGTMTYPLIMMVLGVGVVSLLMIFVIPRLTAIFDEMGSQLPTITKILIGVSEFFQSYWWAVGGGLVVGIWLFNRFRNSAAGRPRWHRFLLRAPLFGGLIRMVAVARFSGTLGTLLGSGVPIITALDIVKNVLGNVILEDVVEEAKVAVKEGASLAEPLRRSGQFPPMVVHMIAVGEQTGELEAMLDNIAKAYEVQIDSRITIMTSLLEPLMIVGMGLVVAFIIFAVLMPMLQMNEILKQS